MRLVENILVWDLAIQVWAHWRLTECIHVYRDTQHFIFHKKVPNWLYSTLTSVGSILRRNFLQILTLTHPITLVYHRIKIMSIKCITMYKFVARYFYMLSCKRWRQTCTMCNNVETCIPSVSHPSCSHAICVVWMSSVDIREVRTLYFFVWCIQHCTTLSFG